MEYLDFYPRPEQIQMPPMTSNLSEQYMMAENLRVAIKLIRQAILGEKEDEHFYDYLITQAPSAEDKDIITSIRDDETKHGKMFREMYTDLTGQPPAEPIEPEFTNPDSYLDGLRKALFGELSAVEKYRKILAGMSRRKHINMMTEIITDELKHADKYNYLISKNRG